MPPPARQLAGLALVCAVCLAAPATAAVRVEVSGVGEALAENVRLTLGKPLSESPRALDRFVAGAPEAARRALAALGYYAAEVEVDTRADGEDTVVEVAVEPNDPVRVNEILLRVDGPARTDGEYMPVIGRIPLRRNAVFVSADYEATKATLLDRAQDLGYFEFAFSESGVRVSRRRLTADITLVAESGPRYTFGEIVFDQNTFNREFLERWLPFDEGEPYAASQLAELTRNLQASGYFASVRVLPQRDRRFGRTVPVRVTLVPKDDNIVGLGIGYSTDDDGIRGQVSWEKPVINRRGHSATAKLKVSRVRQNASFAYRIPRDHRPRLNYYAIEYGLQRAETDDTESLLSTLNLQRVTARRHDWTESLFLRWEHERSTIGDAETETTDLVLPGVSYARTRSKGAPFPSWGQATSFQFLYGSRKLLSTIDFYKSTVSFRYLRAVTPKNALIAGLQYGAISSNDFDRVPVSQRFFAGGDRSVRGFRFRDLSPRNPDGDAVGGRYLEVVNLEYNYRFRERWAAALFVDAGRAFNNFDHPYAVGAGIGVRWQSPVGPFRLDLAQPVSENDRDRGPRLHLSLGADL